jgi:hypothetical protein
MNEEPNEDRTVMSEDANDREQTLSERMRELGRRSGEARRRKKEQREAGGASPERPRRHPYDNRAGSLPRGESAEIDGLEDLHGMSVDELVRRLRDPSTPDYVVPRISAELRQLGSVAERKSATSWVRSVQNREDYEPPSWEEVLWVTRAQGGITAADVVGIFTQFGRLDELRAAVGVAGDG